MEDSDLAHESLQSGDTVIEIYPRPVRYNYETHKTPEKLRLGNNKIVVVAVIGSSFFGNASVLNSITGVPLFTDIEFGSGFHFNDTEGNTIHIFHDNVENVIYLHLLSFLDHKIIDLKAASILSEGATSTSGVEFRNWFDRAELQSVKALLYVFMISHHVIHVSDGIAVPLHIFKLFKVLQQTKQAISPDISKYFQTMNAMISSIFPTISMNTDTRFYPSYCIPYLFFVFRAPKTFPASKAGKDTGNNHTSVEDKLKESLGQQIKLLLASYDLDRGTHAGSLSRTREREGILFTLDYKGFICIILQKPSKPSPPAFGIISNLLNTQLPPSILNKYQNKISQQATKGAAANSTKTKFYATPKRSSSVGISTFVFRMVQQSLKSRHSSLPSSLVWFILSMFLGDFFLFGTRKEASHLILPDPRDAEKLRSMLNINGKFSTNRCGIVLPKAKELYYTDLPALYTTAEHETRVCRALQMYFTHARGPMIEYYRDLLIDEFSLVWRNGRQRCEAKSLTGHYCKYPNHVIPDSNEAEDENNVFDVREHCSDFVSLGACNCGKTRRTRIDPFTLEDANCKFFESRCCERFSRFELPKLATDFDHWSLLCLGNANTYSPSAGIQQVGFIMRYKALLPYELEMASSRLPTKSVASEEDFPSLKNPSRLSHNRGANNSPGQNRGGNFRSQQERPGGWIGYEYECATGHRFIEPLHSIMTSAKQSGSFPEVLSIEIAFRTEIPLFTNCRSKGKNSCGLAKLQRVFITTPSTIALKISPGVQIIGKFSGVVRKLNFTLGCQVSIPNDSFVCLRLPYVYEYENQPLINKQNANSPFQCSFRLVG